MAELKTKQNDKDVMAFIEDVENNTRKNDSLTLLKIMKELSGEEPKMWGDSIVGFGSYHYKSERSSQEGDWMRIAFSPRKQSLSLYFMNGYDDSEELLEKLGKHKLGKGCLYINKLKDVDMEVLRELIIKSLAYMDEHYPK